jgi:hypothetical protein
MTTMMPIVKILVVKLPVAMGAPIGIPLSKIPPIMRILLIPGLPTGRIPVRGSDNIGGSIGIIRGPAILIAVKIIQHTIVKPIALVINPRRIGPHPRRHARSRSRGSIVTAFIVRNGSGGSHFADGAPRQRNCQCNDKNLIFHTYLSQVNPFFPMISGAALSLSWPLTPKLPCQAHHPDDVTSLFLNFFRSPLFS